MAFESVNTGSLSGALSTCKMNNHYDAINKIISTISNSNVIETDSNNNLKKALNELIGRHEELNSLLGKYSGLVPLIAKYQKLQKENERLKKRYTLLSKMLYRRESYTTYETNEKGESIPVTNWRTVKDYAVERAMNEIKKKISDNKIEMEKLESQVAESI